MRITRVGAVVLTLLAVCSALVIFASGGAQAAGLVVGALLLLLLAGEGAGRGGMSSVRRKQEVYTRDAEAWRQRNRKD